MKLKIFRVIFAVIFFLLYFFTLFTSWRLSVLLFQYLTFLQVLPSFIKFIMMGINVFALGWLFILLFTLLAGRWYCSFLCPLGIIQDIFIRLRFFLKKKFKYISSFHKVQYLILGIIILSVAGGSFIFLQLLDPFSFSTRILTGVFYPLYSFVSQSLLQGLRELNIYYNYHPEYSGLDAVFYIFYFCCFLAIACLSFFRGRLYCNLICPLGFVLGLVSRISLYRLQLDQNRCTRCGECEKVCKAGCINLAAPKIDIERCVYCFNCLAVCRFDAVHYTNVFHLHKINQYERRDFLRCSAPLLWVLAAGAVLPFKTLLSRKIITNPHLPAVPPGASGVEHLINHCTGCSACINICPTRVLQPGLKEYSASGILMPYMDYDKGFCEYECNLCTRVCPTGALQPLTVAAKKKVQLGQVRLVKDYCIVYRYGDQCGACAEHCPTKAVFMVPWQGISAPEVRPHICTGCGACENVCPARPEKAVTVTPLPVHKKIEALPQSGEEPPDQGRERFPF